MSAERIHEQTALYALDALEEPERSSFETHLAQCEECAVELADFHGVAAALTGTPPPPLHVWQLITAEIDAG